MGVHDHLCASCNESYGMCFCNNPNTSANCADCNDHPWLNSLRDYAGMLASKVRIPHIGRTDMYCQICQDAYNKKLEYLKVNYGLDVPETMRLK